MNIDFGRLVIHNVIIHEIPRHRKSDTSISPILSETVSPLTDNLRTFLREKLIDSAGSSSAFQVCFLESPTSPLPKYIVEYMSTNGQSDFIHLSQEMAKHLHHIQTGSNPQGLLTVVGCSINHRTALGILKIEKDEGIRLRQTSIGGKITFDLEHIRELMLTKNTKLFKSSLFTLGNDKLDSICGFVRYLQLSRTTTKEIADFFLQHFLGCTLYSSPPVDTKRFIHETQDFINTKVDDPVERAIYENHLLSEMTSEKPVINPRQFAID